MAILLQNRITNNDSTTYMNQSIKEYIKNELSQGLTLARLVSNITPYDDGNFYTIKNNSLFKLDENYESDFIHGSLSATPIIESYLPDGRKVNMRRNYAADASATYLTTIAHTYMNQQIKEGIGLIVAENANARNGDLWLRENPRDIYLYEDEVYHISNSDMSVESIAKSIMKADSGWMAVGVVTSSSQFIQQGDPHFLSRKIIEEMANNAHIIFARAFDMEGYVLWCRRRYLH